MGHLEKKILLYCPVLCGVKMGIRKPPRCGNTEEAPAKTDSEVSAMTESYFIPRPAPFTTGGHDGEH